MRHCSCLTQGGVEASQTLRQGRREACANFYGVMLLIPTPRFHVREHRRFVDSADKEGRALYIEFGTGTSISAAQGATSFPSCAGPFDNDPGKALYTDGGNQRLRADLVQL